MRITSSQRGFTLIEMIVSLAIFSIVALVAIGALVKIIDANNKAQTLQAAITNINFALDSMSRELREGASYDCIVSVGSSFSYTGTPLSTTGCQSSLGQVVLFYSAKTSPATHPVCNLVYAYWFKNLGSTSAGPWELDKGQQTSCGAPINASDFYPVISPSTVTLTDYRLGVDASGKYPLAFIRLSGYAGAREREKTYFDVQTAVSARNIIE